MVLQKTLTGPSRREPPSIILVVEDNPVTAAHLRAALQMDYEVEVVGDGRSALQWITGNTPDLVVLDIFLPDTTGHDLLPLLRERLGEVPILAFSGFMSYDEQARALYAGFDGFVHKPIDAQLLGELIQTYTSSERAARADRATRILVAEDTEVVRKVLEHHLRQRGFVVESACDGLDALERARCNPPDAIVTDGLMPRMDGFRLCKEVRGDPSLSHLPVVIHSSSYNEEDDRTLAERMGASAFVVRESMAFDEVIGVLQGVLESGAGQPTTTPTTAENVDRQHADRLLHHLQRQLAVNASLTRRCAIKSSALSVLEGLAAVMRAGPVHDLAGQILARCQDILGASHGALYYTEENGILSLQACAGFSSDVEGGLDDFFGRLGWLHAVVQGGAPLMLPDSEADPVVTAAILQSSHTGFLVIIPLCSGDTREGVLVLGSGSSATDAERQELLVPARAVGLAVGQAIALARTMARLADSEMQLRQSQKMDALGVLAGGVAHDFNNLLSVINGYSNLILMGIEQDHPWHDSLKEIADAGERAEGLTRQLLTFSRRNIVQLRQVDPSQVVRDLERLLRRTIGEDIQLVIELDENLGHTRSDVGQMEQVILNLVVNARDAMPRGGQLRIATSRAAVPPNHGSGPLDPPPGEYIVLTVADTGCGMDADVAANIFEPFFTTKEAGRGTGLGLSTVYGVVKQANGFIHVDSTPGHGSTFRVHLPVAEEGSDDIVAPSRSVPPSRRGTETILLAEDDPHVRGLARRVLTGVGYHVLEAADGAQALALFEQHVETIALVLTDTVMPVMGGRDLVEKLQRIHPQVKVLYMSGYTDDAMLRHGVAMQRVAFLAKPFTHETLTLAVRRTLDTLDVARR